MLNGQTLLSIILILLVTLNLVLLFIYYLEYRRNQKLLGISRKFNEAQSLYKRSQESANQLLNQTIEESQGIIEQAYKQARQIVEQLKTTAEKIDAKTEAELSGLVEDGKVNLEQKIENFSSKIEDSLKRVESAHLAQAQQIQEKVYQETQANLNQLMTALKEESLKLQTAAGEAAQVQLQQMQTQVTAYKQQQLDKINANLYEILIKTAEKILGEGISLDVQKQTVIKAIEDAKREGMIS